MAQSERKIVSPAQQTPKGALDDCDIFNVEAHFFKNCDINRISKFLAHAKLYEMSLGLPGHFLEAGVYKGTSFSRFRKLGRTLHPDHYRKFLGFDIFGHFPDADHEDDKRFRDGLVAESGGVSIERQQLLDTLTAQGLADNVQLIAGDVRETVPKFLKDNPEVTFSIVNIDVDLYEPTKVVLESVFPRVARGGVVILDDYEAFPGGKMATDEFLAENKRPEIVRKFPFAFTPCYLVKE